jgi:hypothetical protein
MVGGSLTCRQVGNGTNPAKMQDEMDKIANDMTKTPKSQDT